MLCQTSHGVSLFLYTSESDSRCAQDYWFGEVRGALEFARNSFGIQETDWREIPDTLPGCFDDFIHPVPRAPGERQEALIQAADGEWEWVNALLLAGTNGNGMPLLMAIQCDEADIVQAMLNSGAEVNFDFADTTPLLHAIRGVHPRIVELLIMEGADVNKPASNGDLPLQVAMQNNSAKASDQERNAILDMLLSAGASTAPSPKS